MWDLQIFIKNLVAIFVWIWTVYTISVHISSLESEFDISDNAITLLLASSPPSASVSRLKHFSSARFRKAPSEKTHSKCNEEDHGYEEEEEDEKVSPSRKRKKKHRIDLPDFQAST